MGPAGPTTGLTPHGRHWSTTAFQYMPYGQTGSWAVLIAGDTTCVYNPAPAVTANATIAAPRLIPTMSSSSFGASRQSQRATRTHPEDAVHVNLLSYAPTMTTLESAFALARDDNGLAVVSTLRADNTIQSSLINAGPLAHPATGEPTLGFVTYGRVKLANLRARPQIAVTFRQGWQWATVEGRAELAGPDDPQPWLESDAAAARLLRDIFTAAGGTHDDWDEYDRTMREQRRTAVLITPTRVYSNG